jgi:transcription antitermination factor NusG
LIDVGSGGQSAPQWYAVYTHRRAEEAVRDYLADLGVETFLPLFPSYKRDRRRFEPEILFPRYVFARADLRTLGLSPLAYARGVRYVVGVDNTPTAIPDAMIDALSRRCAELWREPQGRFRRGDRVKVTSGPAKGIEAVFDGLAGHARALVLIEFLGRLSRAEVDEAWLEKVL